MLFPMVLISTVFISSILSFQHGKEVDVPGMEMNGTDAFWGAECQIGKKYDT